MLATMNFPRTTARTTALTVSAFVLASCSLIGGGDDAPQGEEPPEGEVEFSSATSPLTGLKQESAPENPVYYVKIENTNGGEPQYGANHADMVIEELVEDGATRLIGMFHSDLPTKVGHVRSARTTDIALVATGERGDHRLRQRAEDARRHPRREDPVLRLGLARRCGVEHRSGQGGAVPRAAEPSVHERGSRSDRHAQAELLQLRPRTDRGRRHQEDHPRGGQVLTRDDDPLDLQRRQLAALARARGPGPGVQDRTPSS